MNKIKKCLKFRQYSDEKSYKRDDHHNFTEEIMKATNTSTTTKSNAHSEVLFQKLGNTWYVFSEVKGDMVYSVLPTGMDPHTTSLELYEVIEEHIEKVSNHYSSRRKPELTA